MTLRSGKLFKRLSFLGVSLRCASGRRAAGYAIASVLRCATHC
ncbi:MAG: hypothetical protein RML94_16150 [Bacteroidia bacterium]|nr:hypothetical protein [Bacteroidia bacterium]